MQVSTELKGMFSYSFIPIIITFLLLIVIILLKFIKAKEKIENIISEPNEKDKNKIKQKYLNLITEILNNLNENKISSRLAYQKLSLIIRNFIYEMINVKVQYYTLSDIDKKTMPILYELVSEYYDPEFAIISKGNILSSIEKTKKVIEKWN